MKRIAVWSTAALLLLAGCAQTAQTAPTPAAEETAQTRADQNALTGRIGHELIKNGDNVYVYEIDGSQRTVSVIAPDGTVSEEQDDAQHESQNELNALMQRDDFVYPPDDCLSFMHGDRAYFYDLTTVYTFENDAFRLVADAETTGLQYPAFDTGFSWLAEPYWYYQLSEDDTVWLCRYDLGQMKILDKTRVRTVNAVDGAETDFLFNMIVIGDTVYYTDDDVEDAADMIVRKQKICRTNLADGKTEELFRADGTLFFQIYEGDLYISVTATDEEDKKNAGIYRMSTDGGKAERIFDGNPVSFWIFDSDWIYIENYPEDEFQLVRLRTADGTVQPIDLPS